MGTVIFRNRSRMIFLFFFIRRSIQVIDAISVWHYFCPPSALLKDESVSHIPSLVANCDSKYSSYSISIYLTIIFISSRASEESKYTA